MSTTSLERGRTWAAPGDEPAAWVLGAPPPRWAGVWAVLGLVLFAVALVATAGGQAKSASDPRPAPASDEYVELSVADRSYAPGHDSGWHSHPGLHRVNVLSGTLTVYDSECNAASYGPGQQYLGGDTLHLARNESEGPVEMEVTYMVRQGQILQEFRTDHAQPPCATDL